MKCAVCGQPMQGKFCKRCSFSYDNFKDEYIKNDFRDYNLFNLIMKNIKGKSVLDIGCGGGYLIRLLNKRGMKTFGLEIDKDSADHARAINPDSEIYNESAENIGKLLKENVDSAVMIDVLEHIEDDYKVVSDLGNIINEKGQLIIVVPCFRFLYGKRDILAGHKRRYTSKMLRKILLKNGFNIKRMRYWNMMGFFPYLISEKIMKRSLKAGFRSDKTSFLNNMLNIWFKNVENNINFGFGLSILCVAEKKQD
ncbi:MAG: class I SAM-dependent methyltransferase [Candidatus Woesearchaeota archaeon]